MPLDPDLKVAVALSEYQFLEPDNWSYAVIDYNIGHSQLVINAKHNVTQKRLKITFLSTIYFHGPFSWRGSVFQVESIDACEQFLRRMGMKESLINVELEVQKLFTVRYLENASPDMTVQIIAGVAFVTGRKLGDFTE